MAAAGSIAGAFAGSVGNPAELIMVRMQADKAKPPESASELLLSLYPTTAPGWWRRGAWRAKAQGE